MTLSKLISTGVMVLTLCAVGACFDSRERPMAPEREDQAATGDDGTGAGTGGDTGGGTTPQGIDSVTFTSVEVANIVLVLNQTEVEQGRVASSRAASPDVKAFAEQMVADHTQALARTEAIRRDLGPANVADTTSPWMKHEGLCITRELQVPSNGAFDLTYMTSQITAHAELVGMIDISLLPSAEAARSADGTTANAALVDELRVLRATVVQHATRALQLQKVLRTAPR